MSELKIVDLNGRLDNTDEHNTYKLYILMRTDLPSMNAGKAMTTLQAVTMDSEVYQ